MARKGILRLQNGLNMGRVDKVVSKVAHIAHRQLVRDTPKRWTGQTRRYWRVVPVSRGLFGKGVWKVHNDSKVMTFLEYGTKAHGPTRAKAMFIPLTRRAFNAGPAGVRAANRGGGKTRKFVYGRDYILRKWVRGIRPQYIVRDYVPFARALMRASMNIHLRSL